MTALTDLTVIEWLGIIKVMSLAIHASGNCNERLKIATNGVLNDLGLPKDSLYVSRKLMQRLRFEFEMDFHAAVDRVFCELEEVADNASLSHRLMLIYLNIVESESPITSEEETLAAELADALGLDIDYYLQNDRTG